MFFSNRTKLFDFHERNTSLSEEIREGAASYINVLCILLVSSGVFALAGMPFRATFISMALISVLCTLVAAMLTKSCCILVPGISLNSMFLFLIGMPMEFSWQKVMTIVLICGAAETALVVSGLQQVLVRAVPAYLQKALLIGIGAFIVTTDLRGIFTDITDSGPKAAFIVLAGTAIIFLSYKVQLKGGIILGMFLVNLIAVSLNADVYDNTNDAAFSYGSYADTFFSGLFTDPCVFSSDSILQIVTGIVIVSLLDTLIVAAIENESASSAAAARDSSVKAGNRAIRALSESFSAPIEVILHMSDSVPRRINQTIVSARSRNGFTSIVESIFILATASMLPLYNGIAVAAAFAILFAIGLIMVTPMSTVNYRDPLEVVITLIIAVSMAGWLSIFAGLAAAFLAHCLIRRFGPAREKVHAAVWVCSIIFALNFILTYMSWR